MTPGRIQQIEEGVEWNVRFALEILDGERDGYDGADGARYIMDLCKVCRELLSEVKGLGPSDP